MSSAVSRLTEIMRGVRRRDTWKQLQVVDGLVLLHDVDRSTVNRGLPASPLIDPVAADLGARGVRVATLAHPWSCLTGPDAWGSPFSWNRTYLRLRLIDRVWFVERAGRAERLQDFWGDLLASRSVSFVLVIGAPEELCEAARSRGIPVIELLHGFGYHRLPFGYGERSANSLPTDFVAFDDVSFTTFAEKFGSSHVVRSTRSVKDEPLSHAVSRPLSSDVTALVTLGWKKPDRGRLVDVSPGEVIPQDIVRAISRGASGIRWMLRPHPVMLRRRRYSRHLTQFRRFISTNPTCGQFDESTAGLDDLLRTVDCHVTMFSETAYQASSAGIKTLLLSPALTHGGELEGTFADLVERGDAQISPGMEADEIIDWVRSHRRETRPAVDVGDLPDATQAVQCILDHYGIAGS